MSPRIVASLTGAVFVTAVLLYASLALPVVLLVVVWLIAGTLSIPAAPPAGPALREKFFATVAVVAGAGGAISTFFDDRSTLAELWIAFLLVVPAVMAAGRLLKGGKYRAGWVSWLFYAAAIAVLIWSLQFELWISFLFIPVVLFIGSLGNLVKQIAARNRSVADSDRAVSIERELAAGQPTERFFLFLRPFYVTGKIAVPNPKKGSQVLLPSFYVEDVVDWETLFAEQVERFGRFVALGRPAEAVGAARIATSEREWREKFVRLAAFADAIFIIPSNRSGTSFEIQWLRERGLLRKCAFVWPANFASVAAQHGDAMTDHNPGGALYTLGPGGAVDLMIAPLPVDARRHLFMALTRVLTLIRTDGLRDFERTLQQVRSEVDALPPFVLTVDDVVPEPEPEPAIELTDLVCVECGRVLTDGFVCRLCERRHAR